MTEEQKPSTPTQPEEVEADKRGQAGEASKDLKQIQNSQPIESSIPLNNASKQKVSFEETFKSFKTELVKSKVQKALKQREYSSIEINPTDVEYLSKELNLDSAKVTELLKVFKGDSNKLLEEYFTKHISTKSLLRLI